MMKLRESKGKLIATFDWVNGGPTEDNMITISTDTKINMQTSTTVELTLKQSKDIVGYLVVDEVNWKNKED